MGIGKRLPLRRRGHPNTPGGVDTKGERCYVVGTVGRVKRELAAAGVRFKKVRTCGRGGVVEVVYTQRGRGRVSPAAYYSRHAGRLAGTEGGA